MPRLSKEAMEERDALFSIGLKHCNKCGLTKEVQDFGSSKTGANGLHAYCRACNGKHGKQRRLDKPEEVKLNNAKRSEKRKVEPYLYEIRLSSGHYYRGFTSNADRKGNHASDLKCGRHCNEKMQSLYDQGFTIVSFEKLPFTMSEREWIGGAHENDPMCLNVRAGDKKGPERLVVTFCG